MEKLRLKPGYLIQQIGTDKVLIPCGVGREVDFSKMIVLNEAAALMVERMTGKFILEEELVEVLMTEYEADYEQVKQDVESFLNELVKQGLVQKEE